VDDLAYRLLDYVCRNVSYKSDNGEFWELPVEVLTEKASDCDGTTLLLVSMLRRFYPADRVYAVVGSYRGYGHAWVELDGEILETTYTSARPVADPQQYRAYARFNDQEVIELWPRSMSRLFQLAHNEGLKLALMTEAVGNYRYSDLPESCVCESCGYELLNSGAHCREIGCPRCGGVMWRKK